MAMETGREHMRFHVGTAHLGRPFGHGLFGLLAERLARIFGTPQYLIGQTALVAGWIVVNAAGFTGFDVYPFILLNLAFSLQAAYAAPLILLAETRQADRDKVWSEADAIHREAISQSTLDLLNHNTDLTERIAQLTEQVEKLTSEIHAQVVGARD